MSISTAEGGDVVRVDFSAARRKEPAQTGQPCGGGKDRQRLCGRRTPEPGTIAALAQLIAERSSASTIDREVDTICRLLRRECRWSEESLTRLRDVTALARSVRQPRPVRSM